MDGKVWSEFELAQLWRLTKIVTCQRMKLIAKRGKGELYVLYYWTDQPGMPIAMRPYTTMAYLPAFADTYRAMGIILRGCEWDTAPDFYRHYRHSESHLQRKVER